MSQVEKTQFPEALWNLQEPVAWEISPVFGSRDLRFGRGGLYGSAPSGELTLVFGLVFGSRANLRFFYTAGNIVAFFGNILMEGQETIKEAQK